MNDLHKKSLVSLLFEEADSTAQKKSLDVEDPVKLPLNKIKSMVEPRIRAFLNKQYKKPAKWDDSLTDNEKQNLIYREAQKPLGDIDSPAKMHAKIEKPTGTPVRLDSFNIGEPIEGPDAKTFYKMKEQQLFVSYIVDKKGNVVGGENAAGDESAYIAIFPPLYTEISEKNFENHKKIFGIQGDLPDGGVAWYEEFDKLEIIPLGTGDKFNHDKFIETFLKTGNVASLQKVAQKQKQLRPTVTDMKKDRKPDQASSATPSDGTPPTDEETDEAIDQSEEGNDLDLDNKKITGESFVYRKGLAQLLKEDTEEDLAAATASSPFLDVHFGSGGAGADPDDKTDDDNANLLANVARSAIVRTDFDALAFGTADGAATGFDKLGTNLTTFPDSISFEASTHIALINGRVYLSANVSQSRAVLELNAASASTKKDLVRTLVTKIHSGTPTGTNQNVQNKFDNKVAVFDTIFASFGLKYEDAVDSLLTAQQRLAKRKGDTSAKSRAAALSSEYNRQRRFVLAVEGDATNGVTFIPIPDNPTNGEVEHLVHVADDNFTLIQIDATVANTSAKRTGLTSALNFYESNNDCDVLSDAVPESIKKVVIGALGNAKYNNVNVSGKTVEAADGTHNVVRWSDEDTITALASRCGSNFLKAIVKYLDIKTEKTGTLQTQIEEHIRVKANAYTAVLGNMRNDLDNIFSDLSSIGISIDHNAFDASILAGIQTQVTALNGLDEDARRVMAREVFNQRNSDDEEHIKEIVDQQAPFSDDINIAFSNIWQVIEAQINAGNLTRMDEFARSIILKGYRHTAARNATGGIDTTITDINSADYGRLFAAVFAEWSGFSSSNVNSGQVNSGHTIKNKNLLNEAMLLNELGIAKLGLAAAGLYGLKHIVATTLIGMGITSSLIVIPLGFAAVMIGKKYGQKLGDLADKSFLSGLNGFCTHYSKERNWFGSENEFEAAIQKNTELNTKVAQLGSAISGQVAALLRREAMLLLRRYFSGISEDTLNPLNITVEGMDEFVNFGFTDQAPFNAEIQSADEEARREELEDGLTEEGLELLHNLRQVPHEIAKTMGPMVNSAITSSSSKQIMNQAFNNSPVLGRVINHIMESNQDETSPEEASSEVQGENFIYKKGLSILLESDEEPTGYRNRGKKKRKLEIKSADELFVEFKDAIKDSLRENGLTSFSQGIRDLTTKLTAAASGMRGRHVIEKRKAHEIIAAALGIPAGAFAKSLLGESAYATSGAPLLTNSNIASASHRKKLAEESARKKQNDVLVGKITNYLFEDSGFKQFNTSIESNRKSKKRRKTKNYLNEKAFYGSLVQALLLESPDEQVKGVKSVGFYYDRTGEHAFEQIATPVEGEMGEGTYKYYYTQLISGKTEELTKDVFETRIKATEAASEGMWDNGSGVMSDEMIAEAKINSYLRFKLDSQSDYFYYKGLAIPKSSVPEDTDGLITQNNADDLFGEDSTSIEGVKTFNSSGGIITIKIEKITDDDNESVKLVTEDGESIGSMKDIHALRDTHVGEVVKSANLTNPVYEHSQYKNLFGNDVGLQRADASDGTSAEADVEAGESNVLEDLRDDSVKAVKAAGEASIKADTFGATHEDQIAADKAIQALKAHIDTVDQGGQQLAAELNKIYASRDDDELSVNELKLKKDAEETLKNAQDELAKLKEKQAELAKTKAEVAGDDDAEAPKVEPAVEEPDAPQDWTPTGKNIDVPQEIKIEPATGRMAEKYLSNNGEVRHQILDPDSKEALSIKASGLELSSTGKYTGFPDQGIWEFEFKTQSGIVKVPLRELSPSTSGYENLKPTDVTTPTLTVQKGKIVLVNAEGEVLPTSSSAIDKWYTDNDGKIKSLLKKDYAIVKPEAYNKFGGNDAITVTDPSEMFERQMDLAILRRIDTSKYSIYRGKIYSNGYLEEWNKAYSTPIEYKNGIITEPSSLYNDPFDFLDGVAENPDAGIYLMSKSGKLVQVGYDTNGKPEISNDSATIEDIKKLAQSDMPEGYTLPATPPNSLVSDDADEAYGAPVSEERAAEIKEEAEEIKEEAEEIKEEAEDSFEFEDSDISAIKALNLPDDYYCIKVEGKFYILERKSLDIEGFSEKSMSSDPIEGSKQLMSHLDKYHKEIASDADGTFDDIETWGFKNPEFFEKDLGAEKARDAFGKLLNKSSTADPDNPAFEEFKAALDKQYDTSMIKNVTELNKLEELGINLPDEAPTESTFSYDPTSNNMLVNGKYNSFKISQEDLNGAEGATVQEKIKALCSDSNQDYKLFCEIEDRNVAMSTLEPGDGTVKIVNLKAHYHLEFDENGNAAITVQNEAGQQISVDGMQQLNGNSSTILSQDNLGISSAIDTEVSDITFSSEPDPGEIAGETAKSAASATAKAAAGGGDKLSDTFYDAKTKTFYYKYISDSERALDAKAGGFTYLKVEPGSSVKIPDTLEQKASCTGISDDGDSLLFKDQYGSTFKVDLDKLDLQNTSGFNPLGVKLTVARKYANGSVLKIEMEYDGQTENIAGDSDLQLAGNTIDDDGDWSSVQKGFAGVLEKKTGSGLISPDAFNKAKTAVGGDESPLTMKAGTAGSPDLALKQSFINYQYSVMPKGHVLDSETGIYYKASELGDAAKIAKNGILPESFNAPEGAKAYYLKPNGSGLTTAKAQGADAKDLVKLMKAKGGAMDVDGFVPVKAGSLPPSTYKWGAGLSKEEVAKQKVAASQAAEEVENEEVENEETPSSGDESTGSFLDDDKLGVDIELKLDSLTASIEKLPDTPTADDLADAQEAAKGLFAKMGDAWKESPTGQEIQGFIGAGGDDAAKLWGNMHTDNGVGTLDKFVNQIQSKSGDAWDSISSHAAKQVESFTGTDLSTALDDAKDFDQASEILQSQLGFDEDTVTLIKDMDAGGIIYDTDQEQFEAVQKIVSDKLNSDWSEYQDAIKVETGALETAQTAFDSSGTDANETALETAKENLAQAKENLASTYKSVAGIEDEGQLKVAVDALSRKAYSLSEVEGNFVNFEFNYSDLIPYIPIPLWGYRAYKGAQAAVKGSYNLEGNNGLLDFLETTNNEFLLNSVATPIAYKITEFLQNYPGLKKLGLKITGKLKREKVDDGLVDEGASGNVSQLFSKSAHSEAKEFVKLSRKLPWRKEKPATEAETLKMMEKIFKENIEDVCVGLILKYDSERKEEAKKDVAANIATFEAGSDSRKNVASKSGIASGGLAAGGLTYLLMGTAATATIASGGWLAPLLGVAAGAGVGGLSGKFGFEALSDKRAVKNKRKGAGRNLRQNLKEDENVKKDVMKIMAVVKSIAKDVKNIQDSYDRFHKSKLSKLLFERNLLLEAKMTGEKVKRKLQRTGACIYGFMDQSTSEFKKAESDFVSSVGILLEDYFGIAVEGIDPNAIQNIKSTAAVGSNVNQDAAPGQPNNVAAMQNLQGTPMPHNMQGPIQHPAQLAYGMSHAGGNNMSELIKLMTSQQESFERMMKEIMDKSMNFSQAAQTLSNEKGTNFTDLEKSLEIGLGEINNNKPTLSKETVNKIYYTLKKSNIEAAINKLDNVKEYSFNKGNFDVEQVFVGKIRMMFNYVDNKVTYDKKTVSKISSFIDAVLDKKSVVNVTVYKLGDVNKLIAQKLLDLPLELSGKSTPTDDEQNKIKVAVGNISLLKEKVRRPSKKSAVKRKGTLLEGSYYNRNLSDLLFEVESISNRKSVNKSSVVKEDNETDLQSEWRRVWNIK